MKCIQIRRTTAQEPWTYADLIRQQEAIGQDLQSGAKTPWILLSEVSPVITLGRRQDPSTLQLKKDIPLTPTDRGGLETYHGPGQWVLFLLDRLDRLTPSGREVRPVVCGLLQALASTAKVFGTECEVVSNGERIGVWTKRGKLASIGISTRKRVLTHGIALNCFATSQSFQGIHPCGVAGARPDFLLAQEDQEKFVHIGNHLIEEVLSRF